MTLLLAISILELATALLAVATIGLLTMTALSARTAMQQFGRQLLPILIPSRVHEPLRKVIFPNDVLIDLFSDQVFVSHTSALYVAIPLRNIGTGVAAVQGLSTANAALAAERTPRKPPKLAENFIDSKTDLLLGPGDISHLTLRSVIPPVKPGFDVLLHAVKDEGLSQGVFLDILHCDHAHGQYTITRFELSRGLQLDERLAAGGTPAAAEYTARALKHWRIKRKPRWYPNSRKPHWQQLVERGVSGQGSSAVSPPLPNPDHAAAEPG